MHQSWGTAAPTRPAPALPIQQYSACNQATWDEADRGGNRGGTEVGTEPRQCKLIARGASQLGLAVRAIHQNWACKANKSEVRYLLRQPPQQPAPI